MFDLSLTAYIVLFIASFFVGFSKTSIGGLLILAVPIVAVGFPPKDAIGILLPIAIFADIIAVIYFRRSCDWSLILRFFPITAIGVVIGYFLLAHIHPNIFAIILGLIILGMMIVGYLVDKRDVSAAQGGLYRWTVGVLIGVAGMLANSAGPLLGIYLLQRGLDKKAFIGTRSWYFLVLNLFKVPFAVDLGLVTLETFTLNLLYLPVIILGGILGAIVINKINMSAFKLIIRIAAGAAAARLIYVGLTGG